MRDESSWRRWARVSRRDPKSEVDDELCHHIEQRIRDYVARGMDPETARKATLERLGNLEGVRNECVGLLTAERRAEERRVLMSVSWLDVKLGLRMLVKYPGLSLVAVIGWPLRSRSAQDRSRRSTRWWIRRCRWTKATASSRSRTIVPTTPETRTDRPCTTSSCGATN